MSTAFFDLLYTILRSVPVGKVVTYGQLAALAGRPRASRAVGACMRVNPDAPATPCHRVVAADGSLHGYSGPGGLATKMRLLQEEGVSFLGSRVNLAQSQWEVVSLSEEQRRRIAHQSPPTSSE